MMRERLTHPKEKLRGVFNRRSIEAAVFDLDGTLIDTFSMYEKFMKDYCKWIAKGNEELAEDAYTFMYGVLCGLRESFSVNPAVMIEPARLVALRYGMGYYTPKIQRQVRRLMVGIYEEPQVEKFNEVDEVLGLIHGAGADTYIVTHANPRTTEKKLSATDLSSKFGGIYCVDDLGEKDTEAWMRGYSYFGVEPANSIMVGDSWTSDIAPAIEIGVPRNQIFRVKTTYDEANKGIVEGICEIDKISDLVDALLRI